LLLDEIELSTSWGKKEEVEIPFWVKKKLVQDSQSPSKANN
jgi:hypothetical protein